MSATTKVQKKGQVTIPTRVREQAGLVKGDVLEFSYERGKIVITPKMLGRSQFPNASGPSNDEYTPAQRGIIDARLTEGLADIKAGRTLGPFDSADEMIAHMKAQIKKSKPAANKTKRSR